MNFSSATSFKVLIVDDDPRIAHILKNEVERISGTPTVCHSAQSAFQELNKRYFDLLILDNRLPDGLGSSIFREIQTRASPPTTILLTGFPDLEDAVKLTQNGLFHYLKKPFDPKLLRKLLNDVRLQLNISPPDAQLHDLVGSSPQMHHVRNMIKTATNNPSATVLIKGETGTGKELVSQIIHSQTFSHSDISPKMVSVNCAALPSELIEAELFGADRGAYTGATQTREGLAKEAESGTLFLDEISEMPLEFQAKLLRFLDTGEYRRVGSSQTYIFSGRIIAASNQNLEAAVAERKFRQDLFYRLDVLSIDVPPLREHLSDIPELVHTLSKKLCAKYNRPKLHIKSKDIEILSNYSYPGNVRELRNILERSILGTSPQSKWLNILPLPSHPNNTPHSSEKMFHNPFSDFSTPILPSSNLQNSFQEHEFNLLKHTLLAEKGIISHVARKLNLSRQAVLRRLDKWPELKELKNQAKK